MLLAVIHWTQSSVVKKVPKGLSLTDLAPFLELEGLMGSLSLWSSWPGFFLGPSNQGSPGISIREKERGGQPVSYWFSVYVGQGQKIQEELEGGEGCLGLRLLGLPLVFLEGHQPGRRRGS